MNSVTDINKVKRIIKEYRKKSKTIGFIPTMGALHQGHLSLVKKAKSDCDLVVVSIFVNPLQFSKGEDYKVYPRNILKDKALLRQLGVDMLFYPKSADIYSSGFSTNVEESVLSKVLCGKSRPGHFRGVCTILTKLFNIIEPDKVYFGQKDYQQVLIIKKIVADLNFPIKICILPTVREDSGLAMSSRNRYLTNSQKKQSLCLSKALILAKNLIRNGERSPAKAIARIKSIVKSEKSARIDYIEILNAKNLTKLKTIRGHVLIALAIYIGQVRLIDNIVLNVKR